jgi:predicted Zn-dependent protease
MLQQYVNVRVAAFRGALAVAFVSFMLGGCATLGINKGQMNIISSDDEVKMGQEMSVEVAKEYELYNNATVTAYVQSVGDRIARVSDRTDIAYHIAVVKKDEVNAFTLPGGYVYLYTGLMNDADDEAELASVIAHEIGHVAARHATEQLTAQYGYELVAGIVLGNDPNSAAKIIADMAATGGFLKYSRDDEFEADQLGAKYLDAGGYDPKGMVDLLEKLKSLESSEPSKFETWLSTHPPTSERLARVEAEIAAFPKSANPVRNAAAYAKIKALLPK